MPEEVQGAAVSDPVIPEDFNAYQEWRRTGKLPEAESSAASDEKLESHHPESDLCAGHASATIVQTQFVFHSDPLIVEETARFTVHVIQANSATKDGTLLLTVLG